MVIMQVFCVVLGGAIFRFLKGIPPLKDQWGYAFTVATIAFHFFIINAYLDPERWTLPMLRFSMILLGFGMSSIVNIAFRPIYAGDTLHKLVAKNFETAATVFERYQFHMLHGLFKYVLLDCYQAFFMYIILLLSNLIVELHLFIIDLRTFIIITFCKQVNDISFKE